MSTHARGAKPDERQGSGHLTLPRPSRVEVEIKKSRFIALAWPVTSGQQAMELIRQASDPSATHNCYAFKAGSEARSSDDGEPGGTAGRPILGAIEAEGLEGVAVLVIRFFGGIKLGSGGLVRAYAGAARDALKAAGPYTFVAARCRMEVVAPYEVLGPLYGNLERCGCQREEEDYLESGEVRLVISIEEDRVAELVQALADASSGRVLPRRLP